MALIIIWSKRAASGYSNILHYLDENFTEKEVASYENEVKEFLERLTEYPELLQKSRKQNVRRGPINKQMILTYRVNKKKGRIELVTIRSSRQKPLK